MVRDRPTGRVLPQRDPLLPLAMATGSHVSIRAAPAREPWTGSGGEPDGQKRQACPIDLFIGSRIRMARKIMHISQEKLALSIGVKFQQIQKYEKGLSRISASRLHKIAVTLGTPFSFFLPEVVPLEREEGGSSSDVLHELTGFLKSSEGLEMNLLFSQIKDVQLRRRVLELVRSIAEGAK